MKKIIPLIFSVFFAINSQGQTVGGWGNCEFGTVATMNAFDPSTNAFDCKKVFVQATNEHYHWDGTQWVIDGSGTGISENIYNTSDTLTDDRIVTLDGSDLTFKGSTDDVFIQTDGKVGIGTTSPSENLDIPGARRVQIGTENGSAGGKLRVDIADGESDNQAIKTMVQQTTGSNYAVNGTVTGVGATNNTALYGWATGATNNYGLRVDEGLGIFDDSVGIGTLDPQALLDVDGGTVRLSDYGGGTITGTETYLLGVDADGDVIELDMDNGYTIFNIVAEENNALNGNTYEWSYGAGESTRQGHGPVLPIDCELFAMTLDHRNGDNTIVRIIKNSDETLATYQVETTNSEYGYNTFPTPLAFVAGDVMNFKTISVDDDGNDAVVTAWFRVRSTPASTSLVNDLLDVSAGSITTGQVLQYNGASFVPVDLSAANITYDNSTSGLTATDAQAAIDELVASGSENIYTANGTLEANRTVTMDGNNLTFDGTDDMIIQDDGKVGIGNTTPDAKLEVTYDRNAAFTGGEPDDGFNSFLSSIVATNTNSGNWSRALTALTPNIADGNQTGLLTFGQGDATRQAGHMYFVDTGSDGDEYIGFAIRSGASDILNITGNGDVGIGTTSPDAKLDVEGGSVRFSDYGVGTYEDTTAVYLLGVEADGDVIEMNTAKNSRIFYPPAMAVPAPAIDTDYTLDLHALYETAFGTPDIRSTGAPGAIPTYSETELYYYVTDYDTDIFENIEIDANGVMEYDVREVPTDSCSFINIVFVIKEP